MQKGLTAPADLEGGGRAGCVCLFPRVHTHKQALSHPAPNDGPLSLQER